MAPVQIKTLLGRSRISKKGFVRAPKDSDESPVGPAGEDSIVS